MKYDICDYDEKSLTVCWAIDGGRIFIHFTSNLSELLALRSIVDEMIKGLEDIQNKKRKKHKRELSLRAKRIKKIKGEKRIGGVCKI